ERIGRGRIALVDEIRIDEERMLFDDRTHEREPRVLVPAAALVKIARAGEHECEDERVGSPAGTKRHGLLPLRGRTPASEATPSNGSTATPTAGQRTST